MSLQFVLGGSGCGKSTFIFENIIERSLKEEEKNFFILVPDQFTMQTQMDLVTAHPRGGILNIDVLSFSRLSHRILEETGGSRLPVLDDTGKSLVLRRVAEELKDEVPVLGSNLKKLGYIHEVKSAVSEFMQYGIGREEMEKMLSVSEQRGGLHSKLKDLNTLYQGFLRYIEDKFITTEETYDRLARQLEKSRLISGSVVVLDGFTGFTPVQNRVIEKLLELAEEVIISVTIDKKGMEIAANEEQQLFSLSKKTIRSLEKMAEQAEIPVLPYIWTEGKENRYTKNPELKHLEKSLFRYPVSAYEEQPKQIEIREADTPEQEIQMVCAKIRQLLTQGYCYRDIAVITSELPAYASRIEETFGRYEIPFFLDQTRGITLNPFIEYIRSALSVLVRQYSYESMFHYLRSGMTDWDREVVDKLENYVLALGIKGKKTWNNLFVYRCKDMTAEDLEELNNIRNEIAEQLKELKSGKQKVCLQVKQLYSFIVKNRCQQKLKQYEEYFASQGEKTKEKEYAQIYRLVMELLEQINALLGEEELTWEEFAQILDAGFGEIQVGTIPQSVDQVVVGDMERTRLKQTKAVFFLGVNDGKIPRQSGKGGILSDIDREFLADFDLELAPTPRQQMFIQRFYLYLNVTKPSEVLYLSYAKLNEEGKSLKPSYFIDTFRKLFPALRVECGEEIKGNTAQILQEGRMYSALQLAKYRDIRLTKEEEKDLIALLKVLKDKQGEKRWVEDILDAVFYTYTEEKLTKTTARLLYGTMIHSSISRLEKMAACAYAHYLQYGLGLKEREEFSFQAVDMGNVFHGVLEIFAEKLAEKNYTWITFPEEGREILHSALESYAISYGNTILYATARNAYALVKMERILWRTVRTLQYQLQKGKFMPKNYEISFAALEDLEAVTFALSEEEKLRLHGRIDRIDTYEDDKQVYVKVVDYKSGSQQMNLAAVYYGLQLQLVVYMNAAMELQKKQNPDKEIIPGAFVYYHISDPMVEGQEGITPEEIEKQIKRELRVSGIVNCDERVLQSLDTSGEAKSDVIPVEYKKDGSLSSRSAVLPREQMELLQKYTGEKVRLLGKEIADGDIGIHPCQFKERDACTFCAYQSICPFDAGLQGFQKKKLEDMEEEILWAKMRKTLEEEQEADR